MKNEKNSPCPSVFVKSGQFNSSVEIEKFCTLTSTVDSLNERYRDVFNDAISSNKRMAKRGN